MNPLVLLIGIITFLICFLVHVIWWRYKFPQNDVTVLIIVFFIAPVIFMFSGIFFKINFVNIIYIILFHIALSCAYIMSYPAAQANCPSLNILLIVDNAMPNGITKDGIEQLLGSSNALLDEILQKMLEENLARERGNMIIPTKFGKLVASFFILFRSILGIGPGGG